MPETCSRCGSSKLIPNIPFPDRVHGHSDLTATVIHENPQAWVSKGTAYGALSRSISGECGHADLKAGNHRELYLTYLRSIGRIKESILLGDELQCLACGEVIPGGATQLQCSWTWRTGDSEA